jgi:hypothetical protein
VGVWAAWRRGSAPSLTRALVVVVVVVAAAAVVGGGAQAQLDDLKKQLDSANKRAALAEQHEVRPTLHTRPSSDPSPAP